MSSMESLTCAMEAREFEIRNRHKPGIIIAHPRATTVLPDFVGILMADLGCLRAVTAVQVLKIWISGRWRKKTISSEFHLINYCAERKKEDKGWKFVFIAMVLASSLATMGLFWLGMENSEVGQ